MLAVCMSLEQNVTKMQEAVGICDRAIRRDPSDFSLFLARYIHVSCGRLTIIGLTSIMHSHCNSLYVVYI